MTTIEHGNRDLNTITDRRHLNFERVVGSIRLFFGRIVLRNESDRIVDEFLNYKPKKR